MKRVVFVEPQIEDSEEIFNIFRKYNPDSSFVNPHICLVFPFESNLKTSVIQSLISNIFSKYSNFYIRLSGLSVSYEENNNFLFLNVIDGFNILKQMSYEIYNSLGDNAKFRGEYIPHITIGKSNSIEDINKIYESSQTLLQHSYRAAISTIYCKKLIKDSAGNTKLEDEIQFNLPKVSNKTM